MQGDQYFTGKNFGRNTDQFVIGGRVEIAAGGQITGPDGQRPAAIVGAVVGFAHLAVADLRQNPEPARTYAGLLSQLAAKAKGQPATNVGLALCTAVLAAFTSAATAFSRQLDELAE